MSLRSQSASDVEHGSTRDVVDGSPVCAEAGAYTAAARHDYSDPWDDDEVPSEQPWHRQLRRDNDGSGKYNEQSGYDPSEYDDNDVTLGGDAHPEKEQQRPATLMGNSYVTEERHRSATLAGDFYV